jgi:hypothetical protein
VVKFSEERKKGNRTENNWHEEIPLERQSRKAY